MPAPRLCRCRNFCAAASDAFRVRRCLSRDPREALGRASRSGLRATWLGHSTVLIEIDGYRVLTDPVWGPRASPSRLVGPKRFQPVPGGASRAAADRPRDRVARPLRPSRLSDDPRAREARRAVRDLARRRRASRGLGRAAGAHRRARLVGVVHAARMASLRVTAGAVAAFLRPRAARPQRHACGHRWSFARRGTRCSSAATPA